MVLAIDIGNSTIHIGLFKTSQSNNVPSLIYSKRIVNNELGDIKSHLPKETIEAVAISSVVPSKNEIFARVIIGVYGTSPYFIRTSSIKSAYPGLGADRIANLIGGRELFGLPVCVIDFGTATTIDVLASNNEYAGGVILPGINLQVNCLHQHTSLLPVASQPNELSVLGKSTIECIHAGIYQGEIYRIKGFIEEIRAKFDPKFVCTGGLGEFFTNYLSVKYEPYLTLFGLYFALNEKDEPPHFAGDIK